MSDINEIINFWFKNKENWYKKDKIFDAKIKDNYIILYKQAADGSLKNKNLFVKPDIFFLHFFL